MCVTACNLLLFLALLVTVLPLRQAAVWCTPLLLWLYLCCPSAVHLVFHEDLTVMP